MADGEHSVAKDLLEVAGFEGLEQLERFLDLVWSMCRLIFSLKSFSNIQRWSSLQYVCLFLHHVLCGWIRNPCAFAQEVPTSVSLGFNFVWVESRGKIHVFKFFHWFQLWSQVQVSTVTILWIVVNCRCLVLDLLHFVLHLLCQVLLRWLFKSKGLISLVPGGSAAGPREVEPWQHSIA